MPKVLIAYYSRSGHTKAMADLVAEGVKAASCDVVVSDVEKLSADDLLDYDGIILGSPTYYGHMSWQAKRLLDASVKHHGKLEGKVGGAFTSSANVGGGNETTVRGIIDAFLIHGMIVPGMSKGDHYGPVAVNAPDDRAATNCRRMGETVGSLCAKLFG